MFLFLLASLWISVLRFCILCQLDHDTWVQYFLFCCKPLIFFQYITKLFERTTHNFNSSIYICISFPSSISIFYDSCTLEISSITKVNSSPDIWSPFIVYIWSNMLKLACFSDWHNSNLFDRLVVITLLEVIQQT